MFETVRSAVGAVREALGDLDAEALSGPAAAEMLGVFSELAAVAQAGLTVAAGAVARTNAWAASGARSARAYVSGTAGVSVGSAERVIDLAEALRAFPATAKAFSCGVISAAQAEEVTRAAGRDASAEAELLDLAQGRAPFRRLRDRANSVRSKSAKDDAARAEAAHRGRDVRTWVDPDGVGHLHAKGLPGAIGALEAWIRARADVIFDEARASGRREAPGNYRFDALMELLDDAGEAGGLGTVVPGAGNPTAGPTDTPAGLFGTDGGLGAGSEQSGLAGPDPGGGPEAGPGARARGPDQTDGRASRRKRRRRVDMLIRVDFAALRAGYVGKGEICEVAGVGPVSVAEAKAYLGEAALKFILTEGTDIKAVAHLGRHLPSPLRSALLWRYRSCASPDCDRDLGLQVDHDWPYAKGGPTSIENLRPLCHQCHAEKTRRDYPNGTAAMRGRSGKVA